MQQRKIMMRCSLLKDSSAFSIYLLQQDYKNSQKIPFCAAEVNKKGAASRSETQLPFIVFSSAEYNCKVSFTFDDILLDGREHSERRQIRGKVTFRHFGRIIQDHFLKKPLVALSCSQFRTKYRLSKRIRLYCGTCKYQDNSEYAVEYEDPYGESHKSDVET